MASRALGRRTLPHDLISSFAAFERHSCARAWVAWAARLPSTASNIAYSLPHRGGAAASLAHTAAAPAPLSVAAAARAPVPSLPAPPGLLGAYGTSQSLATQRTLTSSPPPSSPPSPPASGSWRSTSRAPTAQAHPKGAQARGHRGCSTSAAGSRVAVAGAAMAAEAAAAVLVTVGGQADPVEVLPGPGISQEDIRRVLESGPLRQWLDQLGSPSGLLPTRDTRETRDGATSTTSAAAVAAGAGAGAGAGAAGVLGPSQCRLHSILVQGVDYFGRRPGFVKFKVDMVDIPTGARLPGIVFARGGAVGVLMLLRSQDEAGAWDTHALLTEQVRVPIGRSVLEMPAGMLDDDSKDFVGTAAKEVEEETGIHIRVGDLVDLTALLHPSTGQKMLPSPGGCDEDITLFLYRAIVDHKLIRSLQGKQTGLREHGELIRLHAVPLSQLWRLSGDCKILSALALYENGLREKLIDDVFLPKTT